MRKATHIQDAAKKDGKKLELIVELLLDIRELLSKQNRLLRFSHRTKDNQKWRE